MLLHCHTSPPIDPHHIPSCNPGKCSPQYAIIDVEVDQRAPDFVLHVLHRVKVMPMWLAIAADNNEESNGVNEWSPLMLRELLSSHS